MSRNNRKHKRQKDNGTQASELRPTSLSATPERLDRANGAMEVVAALRDANRPEQDPGKVQRIIAAPLDRMWKDGRISQREFEAGDKLRADAHAAAIDPAAGSVDWNRAGGSSGSRVPSMFQSQAVADARLRFRDAEKKITGLVWDVLKQTLIHENPLEDVGHVLFAVGQNREAHCAGLGAFRVALGTLADYYRV